MVNIRLKIFLAILLPLALSFGFLHIFVPENWGMNFERLHIFLFNLCGGGTVIICFTEEKSDLTFKSGLFLFLSISYALLAFLKVYLPAILISFLLAVIVEKIRIKHYSFFPENFFHRNGELHVVNHRGLGPLSAEWGLPADAREHNRPKRPLFVPLYCKGVATDMPRDAIITI